MKNLVQLRNEMIKFLYNDPNCEFSINDLSKAFNCNKKTIYGLIKKNNIKQKKINKKNNNKKNNSNENDQINKAKNNVLTLSNNNSNICLIDNIKNE